MDALVILMTLLPLTVAGLLAAGGSVNAFARADSAGAAAEIGFWGLALTALQAVLLASADLFHENNGLFSLGPWLGSGELTIRFNFITTGFRPFLAAWFAVSLAMIGRSAATGWPEILGLAAALLLFITAGNAGLALIGWVLAGHMAVCLAADAGPEAAPAADVNYIAAVHRIGDAAFMAGAGLSYFWLGSVSWSALPVTVTRLSVSEATGISVCFLLAAMTKSAQLPFTLSLPRALTSAQSAGNQILLSHVGIVLILGMRPVFEKTPLPMALLLLTGAATALYSHTAKLKQTCGRRALAFSAACQLGLMFAECGLGWWRAAVYHLCLHSLFRIWQLANASRILKTPPAPVNKPVRKFFAPPWFGGIQFPRCLLAQLIEWSLIKPVARLSADMAYFEVRVLERYADKAAAALLSRLFAVAIRPPALPEAPRGRHVARTRPSFWRRACRAAGAFEHGVLKPRYLALFAFVTLLVAF